MHGRGVTRPVPVAAGRDDRHGRSGIPGPRLAPEGCRSDAPGAPNKVMEVPGPGAATMVFGDGVRPRRSGVGARQAPAGSTVV